MREAPKQKFKIPEGPQVMSDEAILSWEAKQYKEAHPEGDMRSEEKEW